MRFGIETKSRLEIVYGTVLDTASRRRRFVSSGKLTEKDILDGLKNRIISGSLICTKLNDKGQSAILKVKEVYIQKKTEVFKNVRYSNIDRILRKRNIKNITGIFFDGQEIKFPVNV